MRCIVKTIHPDHPEAAATLLPMTAARVEILIFGAPLCRQQELTLRGGIRAVAEACFGHTDMPVTILQREATPAGITGGVFPRRVAKLTLLVDGAQGSVSATDAFVKGAMCLLREQVEVTPGATYVGLQRTTGTRNRYGSTRVGSK